MEERVRHMKSNSVHKLKVRHEHGGVTERYGSYGKATNWHKRDIKSTWLLGAQTYWTWKISGNQGTPYTVWLSFFLHNTFAYIKTFNFFNSRRKIEKIEGYYTDHGKTLHLCICICLLYTPIIFEKKVILDKVWIKH